MGNLPEIKNLVSVSCILYLVIQARQTRQNSGGVHRCSQDLTTVGCNHFLILTR